MAVTLPETATPPETAAAATATAVLAKGARKRRSAICAAPLPARIRPITVLPSENKRVPL